MKRLFFESLIVFCGLVLTLVSCDNKLTILGEDSSNMHAFESQKEQYEKDHDVRIAFRPNTFEDANEKANQDFMNQTGLFDIVLQYNFALSSYVQNDYVMKLDSLLQLADNKDLGFKKDLFPNAWKEVGWFYENPSKPDTNRIQAIGFPFATNTMLLVYNKQMFGDPKNKKAFKEATGKDLTIPTDWELFKQIAKFFTNKDKKTYGICMQGSGDWLYYEYCDILYGNKASIFNKKYGWQGDKDNIITINTPEAEEATRFYLSLKPFNKGNFITVDATEQVKQILQGDVAMGLVWSDYLYGIVQSSHSSNFGYAPIPGGYSPIAGGCFYVNRNTKNPKEAIDFILYMMKPEVQVELALKGLCSPLRSTYKNEDVKKRIPYAEALEKSLERGSYMYEAGLEAGSVSQIVTKYIQQLWGSDNPDNVKSILSMMESEIVSARQNAYKEFK